MFPIRDTVVCRRFPVMTWLLIALNAAAFLYELRLFALFVRRDRWQRSDPGYLAAR